MTAAAPSTRSAPTLSRRQATGAESARNLLFTVLGELVLPTGGSAWTSSFIEVLGRLDVEEKASRQALMRTAADGWLASERVGRRTTWHLTPAAERLLREGTERIFGFTPVIDEWDGQWTVVVARTPETDRAARHLLRTRLGWAGFGNPYPGLWLSPGSGQRSRALQVLDDAGVFDGHVFIAEHSGGSPLAALVDQAWDLSALAHTYDQFITDFSASTRRDPIARVVELVHAWRRFPWIDPGLPAVFLPPRWSGTHAAKLFSRLHAKWASDAIAEWRTVSELS
jgi:phenylacetic acid degradation operon negative regulatory protein